MSTELEWMEREERYRQRVTRLLVGLSVLVFAVLGTLLALHAKHQKAASRAAATAVEAAQRAEAKRQRDAFSADSAAAAGRYADFQKRHAAQVMPGMPFLEVPLPKGDQSGPFVQRLWSEYAHVIDPQGSQADAQIWYTQYHVDVMNRGPLRPRSVLLPAADQQGTALALRKADFPKIVTAQVAVGMRPQPPPPADSTQVKPPVAVPPAAGAPAAGAAAAPPAAPPPTPAPAESISAPTVKAAPDTSPAAKPPGF